MWLKLATFLFLYCLILQWEGRFLFPWLYICCTMWIWAAQVAASYIQLHENRGDAQMQDFTASQRCLLRGSVLSGNKEVVGSDWRLCGEGVRLELLWRLLWLADSLHCRFLGSDWLGCSFTIAVCVHRGLRLVSVCSSGAGARAACWHAAPCVPFPCFASVYQACPGTRWLSSHSILFWCCYHIMKPKRTPAAVVIMFISIQQQHAFTSSKPTVSNCIYKPKEGGVLFSDVQSHLRDDAWHVRHQLWEHFAHVFGEAVWVTEMVLPLWCWLVHSVEQRNALTGPIFDVEVAFCPLKRLITSVENNRLW